MATVKLPVRFFDDRAERELPMPNVIRCNSRYYLVDRADPALVDYLDDAQYYAADVGGAPFGLIISARHTVKALTA